MSAEQIIEELKMTEMFMSIPRCAWRYAVDREKGTKLSNAMYSICVVVSQNDGISQDGVANILKMDKSSVAKIIAKGIKAGYLVRDVNEKDHREYKLHLTMEGNDVIKTILASLKQWQESVLTGLSEEECTQFMKYLSIANNNARKLSM